jgi:hypothetical protein
VRRALASVLVTAIAVLVPASAARAEPPPRPVEAQLLWPLCVQLLGTFVCIPA